MELEGCDISVFILLHILASLFELAVFLEAMLFRHLSLFCIRLYASTGIVECFHLSAEELVSSQFAF